MNIEPTESAILATQPSLGILWSITPLYWDHLCAQIDLSFYVGSKDLNSGPHAVQQTQDSEFLPRSHVSDAGL